MRTWRNTGNVRGKRHTGPSAEGWHLQAGPACSIPEEAAEILLAGTRAMLQSLSPPSPASFVSLLRLYYWQFPTEKREQLQSSSISACDLAVQSCWSWGLPAQLLIGKQSWQGAAVGRTVLEPGSAPGQGREQTHQCQVLNAQREGCRGRKWKQPAGKMKWKSNTRTAAPSPAAAGRFNSRNGSRTQTQS